MQIEGGVDGSAIVGHVAEINRLPGCGGDDKIVKIGFGIARDAQSHGVRQGAAQRGRAFDGDGPRGVGRGGGVHLLHPIAVGMVGAFVVEVDEVRIPAMVPILGEQRSVGGHGHHIAVEFHASHEGRFGQAVDQLGVPGAVFAEVDLRPLAVRVVVVVEVVEPPAGRLVGMFVDDRQTRFARVLPAFLIILTAGGGTDGADDDDVRICGFDGVENLLEAVFEHVVDEILVADAEVFEAERLRVTHGGALGAPFGGGAAVAEFDEVEYFIDVSGHILLRHRHRALAGVLAAHAGGQHRQRLGADSFAQAQVFVVADAE